MKLKFEPEDFHTLDGWFNRATIKNLVVDIANQRLQEMLRDAPAVYKATGYGHFDKWIEDKKELDAPPSHQARLIEIEVLD